MRGPKFEKSQGNRGPCSQVIDVKSHPFWSFRSVRMHLAVILAFVVLANTLMRNTLSMAILCMVNNTAVQAMDSTSGNFSAPPPGCEMTEEAMKQYEGPFIWTALEQGMLFSAIYWGGLISGLPAGWLADKYSPKLLVALCLGGAAVGTFLTPVLTEVGGYSAMFLIRVVMGIAGQACILPSIASMTALWIPPTERSTIIAFYTSGNQLASIIGMPMNAALCDSKEFLNGWPSIFYVNGVIALIILALWIILVTNKPDNNPIISEPEKMYIKATLMSQNVRSRKIKFKKVPWKKLLFSAPMLTAIYCSCLTGIMTTTLSSFLPIYFRSVLFLSLRSNGFLNSLPYISQFSVKMIMSVIADRLKKRSRLSATVICKIFNSIGTFGPAIFLLALSFMNCTTKVWAVLFLVLTNGLFAGTVPGYLTSMVSFAPRYTGTVNSIGRFCGQVASVITPYVIGALTDHNTASEWRVVYLIISVMFFLGGISFIIFGTAEIQSWVDEDKTTDIDVAVVDSPTEHLAADVRPHIHVVQACKPSTEAKDGVFCQKF